MSANAYDLYQSAFLAWVGEDTDLAADVPGVIVTNRVPDKKGEAPAHLLTARRRGGAIGQDNYPDFRPRLDIFCYSSTPHEAVYLAGQVIARCLPLPPAIVGFRKNGVACTNIAVEMGLISDIDQRTEWYICLFSLRLDINPGVTT